MNKRRRPGIAAAFVLGGGAMALLSWALIDGAVAWMMLALAVVLAALLYFPANRKVTLAKISVAVVLAGVFVALARTHFVAADARMMRQEAQATAKLNAEQEAANYFGGRGYDDPEVKLGQSLQTGQLTFKRKTPGRNNAVVDIRHLPDGTWEAGCRVGEVFHGLNDDNSRFATTVQMSGGCPPA